MSLRREPMLPSLWLALLIKFQRKDALLSVKILWLLKWGQVSCFQIVATDL